MPTAWSQRQAHEALSAWISLLDLHERHPQPARTELFHEGASAHGDLWLIEEGIVLLTGRQAGETTVLGLRLPGQVLDQCTFADGALHRYTALTLTPCVFRRVNAAMLREREVDDPNVARLVQRQLRIDLQNAAGYVLELKYRSPEQRFRQLLRLLADVSGALPAEGVLRLTVPLRDEEIAGLLGVSVRQFKRVKKQMRDSGDLVNLHQHEITIRWAGQS